MTIEEFVVVVVLKCLVFIEQQHLEEGTEISHMPLSCTFIASPMINITHQKGTFVVKDEPTLIHNSHPKSLVYFRIYFQ